MRLTDLIYKTRLYTRDNNSYMFSDTIIKTFINEGIDRIAQYKMFVNMPYLEDSSDEPKYIPRPYHYMLALFAASRCFDMDERFYEGTEKRNEFESLLNDMLAEIHAGNLEIVDAEGTSIKDDSTYIEYVTDLYFHPQTEGDGITEDGGDQ